MDYFELVFMHFLLKTRTVQRSGRETEILICETLCIPQAFAAASTFMNEMSERPWRTSTGQVS